ncbi:hypothetical protein Tco_1561780 [Tanacetum coccineum]
MVNPKVWNVIFRLMMKSFSCKSLEVVGNVVQEDEEIDTDILLIIKDDILREKLLKVNLLIAKIEALKDNPTPSSNFVTKSPFTSSKFFLEETNTFDNSLPQFETFNFLDDHTKETSSGSTTTHADISLPEYDSFHLDMNRSGNFTMDVNEFFYIIHRGISFPVFDTLLPFSSENEDNIFNPGILASNEEKSPHLLSHRGFKAFQLISESPMMISGGDIPILDVSIARIFEASRAHGFVLRSLELQILSFIMGIQYPNLID